MTYLRNLSAFSSINSAFPNVGTHRMSPSWTSLQKTQRVSPVKESKSLWLCGLPALHHLCFYRKHRDLWMTCEGQDKKCCVQAKHTPDRTMQGGILKLHSTHTGGVDVHIPSVWHSGTVHLPRVPTPHSSPRRFEVPVEHAVVASPAVVRRRAHDLQVQLLGERRHRQHGPAALPIRGTAPFVPLRRARCAP